MNINEIRSWPIINGHYVIFSGKANASGVALSWQAIAVEDVSDSYYCLERIIEGEEISTRNRREIKYNNWTVVLDFLGIDVYHFKEVAQWHSAEHKIINLLKNNLSLSLEEAKKISDISSNCGGDNEHLITPENFQILEVLVAGMEIKKQIEKSLMNGGKIEK